MMSLRFSFLSFFLLCSILLGAQDKQPVFNQALADSLGADAYGMKAYVLVILKTGKVKITDKAKTDSLFKGHLSNIDHLAKVGKLTVAGPLGKNKNEYRGIFILNVKTKEEATQLLETDPAVKAGLLDHEIYEWYGSAALPLYLKYHDQVQKTQF